MIPSRFTCEQVFARLDDYVDRELSPEEMRMIQEHLEACAVCAGEHHFEATVIAEVRERLQRIDMPPTLAVRIAAQLAQAQRSGG